MEFKTAWLSDPTVFAVNRLPACSDHEIYASAAEAELENSSLVRSLDGVWLAHFAMNPAEAPDALLRDASCDDALQEITVPCEFQLENPEWDPPHYVNTQYPWDGWEPLVPPQVSETYNPTVTAIRRFDLTEADMHCGRIVLTFGAVEAAVALYVNGSFVGYAEDSFTPHRFDVTPFVHAGENRIAARIFKRCTGSWVEDQDFWRFSGIHRSVTLTLEPRVHLADIFVHTPLTENYTRASLVAEMKLDRPEGSVRVTLTDAQGKVIVDETRPAAAEVTVSADAPGVSLWSVEAPTLYQLTVTLTDGAGLVSEVCRTEVGFRAFEMINKIMCLNGKRIVFHGVNRHEFNCDGGRVMTRELMERDVRDMKRMNINAVRTCHYPDSELWYDLCDEMGILVLCECNLETHGVMGEISHTPQASMAYVERAMRMVMQHKNHACIYGWSLGNESGFGPNHAAMYGLIKEYDKTRICQYEAGNPEANISDIRGQMYATEKQIMGFLTDPRDNRPVILVEYLYQIRNTGGRMSKFIELTRRYERFQGGFIWDWQDKALLGKTEAGDDYFAHGGDFNEGFVEPVEPVYMTNNGIVRADLDWKPVAYDVKEAYAPLLIDRPIMDSAWAALAGDGMFSVVNNSLLDESDAFSVSMAIQDNVGAEIDRKEISVPNLKPGEETILDLRDMLSGYDDGKAHYVEFAVTRKATGEEVARRQYMYRDEVRALPRPAASAAPAVYETGDAITVSGEGFSAVICKATGALCDYTVNGQKKILSSRISIDRPYCGLDAKEGWGWREVMDQARATAITFETSEILTGSDSVTIKTAFSGKLLSGELAWTIYGDSAIACALDGQTGEGLRLPRLGVEFTIPGCMEDAAYTGYGPMENYSDRMLAPRFGKYSARVDELGYDYAPPSENGGHEGCIALELSGDCGKLSVAAAKPFHFDAHHCTVEDLKAAMHTHEVPRRDEITLHLDAWHMPIGGDMAWSTMIDNAEAPHAGFHSLRVIMR